MAAFLIGDQVTSCSLDGGLGAAFAAFILIKTSLNDL
jgi:hypothetical protein